MNSSMETPLGANDRNRPLCRSFWARSHEVNSLMANARQLPSGSWRVQVYAGKNAADKPQYRSFTAPSKKEAEYHPELTLRTPLPQREHKEQKILEPGQIAVLLAAVEGGPMELPVLMGVWLCMRASEIAALTWDCIDFERKTLTTKKALVRSGDGSWVEKTTKTTSSTRTISLPEHILGKLEAARARASGDRVVPLSGASIYGRLKTILRRNGL